MEIGGRQARPEKSEGAGLQSRHARRSHRAGEIGAVTARNIFGGPVKYVLAGSGHIAGVVNPPSKPKYQYWTGEKPDGQSSKLAEEQRPSIQAPGGRTGSNWLKRMDAETVTARKIGGGKLKPTEDAPGSYVKVKSWT